MVGGGHQAISRESLFSDTRTTTLHPHHPAYSKKFFYSLGLSSFPISGSVVRVEAHRTDPAFRVEFKCICRILQDYCVIVGVVVVPPSAPSTVAFGRFWALRALSR